MAQIPERSLILVIQDVESCSEAAAIAQRNCRRWFNCIAPTRYADTESDFTEPCRQLGGITQNQLQAVQHSAAILGPEETSHTQTLPSPDVPGPSETANNVNDVDSESATSRTTVIPRCEPKTWLAGPTVHSAGAPFASRVPRALSRAFGSRKSRLFPHLLLLRPKI